MNQLNLILNLVGTPSEDDMNDIASERAKNYIKNRPNLPGVPFETIFPQVNPMILDLLKKMLAFNPVKKQ